MDTFCEPVNVPPFGEITGAAVVSFSASANVTLNVSVNPPYVTVSVVDEVAAGYFV